MKKKAKRINGKYNTLLCFFCYDMPNCLLWNRPIRLQASLKLWFWLLFVLATEPLFICQQSFQELFFFSPDWFLWAAADYLTSTRTLVEALNLQVNMKTSSNPDHEPYARICLYSCPRFLEFFSDNCSYDCFKLHIRSFSNCTNFAFVQEDMYVPEIWSLT